MITKNRTLSVSWQIYYQHVQCDRMWRVRVATQDYTLYPNQFPEDVPITQISEYNVTINSDLAACTDNVTLSLLITENVLEHVPYIVCIIRTGSGATSESHRSDTVPVYLPPTVHTDKPTTPIINSVTTPTVSQGNRFTLTPAVSNDIIIVSDSSSIVCRPHRVLLLTICFYLITYLIMCA